MRLFKRVGLPFVALLMCFTFMLPTNQQPTNRSNAAFPVKPVVSYSVTAYYPPPTAVRTPHVSRAATRPPVPKPKNTTVPHKYAIVTHSNRTLAWWHKVGSCMKMHESGGNYQRNSGNGKYGAYQFLDRTWQHVSHLSGHASSYSPAIQDQFFYYTLIHLIKTDTIRAQQWPTWRLCV